ncbi:MAG TPA: glycoside hydrolase family 3 N-terminal domain-containing protein, partial [Terriglobales bacterium]|nr:glycoside hydrolase family 3 N-terminal domain-containing protein [Terriglobales bacterium]
QPIKLDKEGERWAEKTLKKMTLEEKVGQMFMIWARVEFQNIDSADFKKLTDAITKYHVGGFGVTVPVESGLLVKGDPYEAAMLTNNLQRAAKVPLFMAADFERGLTMRLNGPTMFPYAMAFGAAGKPEYAEEFGRITGLEARAIGIHWNWFPDTDVNSNPVNPVINTRSFSGDPQQVGELAAAYIKGAHESGMMTTAKHFPGHGDTATDTHIGFAMVNGNQQRLDSVELPPFQKAIETGVDSVMIAHVTVPALDPDPNHVASTSPKIVTDLLKHKMGFKGLVVTDALDMNGLMRLYSQEPGVNPSGAAAVAAVEAGNDMLIIPHDLVGGIDGVVKAVRDGQISEKQIDASVLKILKAKASIGLNKARLVDPEAVGELVAQPQNVAKGQQIADAAVTLVRDSGTVLPFEYRRAGTIGGASPYTEVAKTTNRTVVVVFTDDLRSDMGWTFARDFRMRENDANVMFVEASTAASMTNQVMTAVQQAEKVVVPVYSFPVAGRVIQGPNGPMNSVALPEASANLLHQILGVAAKKTVVMAMGNPYVASDFPEVQTYLCTFSFAPVSELSAVKALFGEIPIGGHLPVNIPEIAQRGEGINRPQILKGVFNPNVSGK